MTRADLRAQMRCTCFNYNERKRVKGIEPSCAAWEAAVLPLNYTRGEIFDFRLTIVIGSLKQFKSSLVGECRFAIHSARCARSGQVLQAFEQSLPGNHVVFVDASILVAAPRCYRPTSVLPKG